MAKALTVRVVEQIKPSVDCRREIPDGLLRGLYLIVQPSGVKSWAVRYRHSGHPRKHTLGRFPKIDLIAARDLGSKALRTVAAGKDPAAEKRENRRIAESGIGKKDLIETVVAEYLLRFVKPTYRDSSAAECERLFNKEILPKWRKRKVDEITKRDVLTLLDGVVDRGVGLTANRTFSAVRRFFNWCVDRDIIGSSPCVGVKMPTVERSRDRTLTENEIRWLWRACDESGYPFGPLTKLLLLTGQRRNEVTALPAGELNAEKRLWTIPGARTKNGEQHDVPLSDEALAVIKSVPKIQNADGYLFTTNAKTPVSGFSRAKRRLDKLMLGYARADAPAGRNQKEEIKIAPWVIHDLRRTVASGLAELEFNLPVIEKVINHISGSFAGVVGVYQRHSFAAEKRAALDAWGDKVSAIVSSKPKGNVIALPRRKAAGR